MANRRAPILVPFSAVMLLCVLFMGYYNFRITGHPSVFPYVVNVRSHFRFLNSHGEKLSHRSTSRMLNSRITTITGGQR